MKKIIAITSLVVLLAQGGCDRSLRFDDQGVPHGSGDKVVRYKSGAIKLIDHYEDGKLLESRWFKPDGTMIQQTLWIDGTGQGIYLREDGSIRRRLRYVNGIADGESTQYDEAGNATTVMYRAGKKVEPDAPTTRESTP